ncbi:unnamed protein product [Phytophthora lilii]|uniref:Unnamed protein product n=1 Tax=Phytophthora lilii TaxID=2077276 RepID=A0A9W6YL66_9STRA|nr:unnamed protein product [Phytophthora lilii]
MVSFWTQSLTVSQLRSWATIPSIYSLMMSLSSLQQILVDKCHAFGNAELAKRITASHPTGHSLAAAMERDGLVHTEAFCSWYVEETRFDTLNESSASIWSQRSCGTGTAK